MKKPIILFIVVSFCLVTSVCAQVDKGNFMLGGTLSFSSDNTNKPSTIGEFKTTQFSFAPKFGVGLSGNWIFGGLIEVDVAHLESTTSSIDDLKNATYLAGIFVRKFFPFKNQFGFFGEGNLKYGFGKNTTSFSSTGTKLEEKLKEYSISVNPGFYFKPTQKFFIEASIGNIGYAHTTNKPDNGEEGKEGVFEFSLTNNLSLGLFFIF
jgi:hypothetical protein